MAAGVAVADADDAAAAVSDSLITVVRATTSAEPRRIVEVTNVPQCLTCSGAVLTSHAWR